MKTAIIKSTYLLSILALTVVLAGAILADAQQFNFTTLAGSARGPGHSDGPGSAARFRNPGGVAVDSAGNVYVADTRNHTIRKITPNGVVSTLAGLVQDVDADGFIVPTFRVGDYADGTGNAARFNSPSGVAVDSAGNVYVADTGNHTIREISPAAVVTTVAGLALNSGSVDGTGSAARFNEPSGVAVDRAGNVYVAELSSHTIRKITPGGVVSTLAGMANSFGSEDGKGSAARFRFPNGVAVDGAGNVYVTDTYNNTIRKITPDGVVSTLAGLAAWKGGTVDGTGSAARFYNPIGVAVDSAGNVYVADTGNHTIRTITPAGVVSTLAGLAQDTGGDGFPDGAFPARAYVASTGSAGAYADGTGSAARFNTPAGVAVDGHGNVYVADAGNHAIRTITSGGVVRTLAGLAQDADGDGFPDGGSANGTGSAARFRYPNGVAVDGNGNVYVADTGNHTIRKITSSGVVSTLAGLAGRAGSEDGAGSAARFAVPTGVAVDSADIVYVADRDNNTIRKITPDGMVSTLAGRAGSRGSTDGRGSDARFYYPSGVAVDSAANIYVADNVNRTIRMITPVGVVSTLAGLFGGCNGFGCGGPLGVAVDSARNVYVTEWGSRTIRKITPLGVVSTVAGVAGSAGTVDPGSADGTGSDARFSGPVGVAVDSTGNIYVADQVNHTIRLGTPVHITQPALTRNSLLRLPNGQFQVEVTASTNQLVLIQATSVLPAADWITLQTGTLSTGQMTFTDPHASSFTVRFYRAISPVP